MKPPHNLQYSILYLVFGETHSVGVMDGAQCHDLQIFAVRPQLNGTLRCLLPTITYLIGIFLAPSHVSIPWNSSTMGVVKC